MFWVPLTYLILSTLTPGPVTIMTIHNTIRYGRPAGTVVALGGAVTTALFVALSLVLVKTQLTGLPLHSTVFYQQSGALFIMMLGLLSGYKVLFGPPRTNDSPHRAGRLGTSFFTGMGLMAPYLPQAILFYTVILPEHALSNGVVNSILLLGGIKIALTISWYTLLAQMAQSIQAWFFNQQTQRVVELTGACFLLFISVTLLVG